MRPVSRFLPATPPTGKRTDRLEVLRDANYFAGELLRRLEQLANLDAKAGHWHQAAKLVSRVRDLVRYWALEEAKRRRADATRFSPDRPPRPRQPSYVIGDAGSGPGVEG